MPIVISRILSALLLGGTALLTVLTLAGCTSSPLPPQTTAFNGLELPSPQPVGGANVQPSPAWLIVGDKAVPATYGSFCYRTTCVDMMPPHMMPDIATADLSAGEQTVIVVGSDSVKEFNTNIQDWTAGVPADPAAVHNVAAEGKVEDNLTIFTLEQLPDTGDQLLQAFVTFEEGGDASYLWRINPEQ
jgi:hypothetical protein